MWKNQRFSFQAVSPGPTLLILLLFVTCAYQSLSATQPLILNTILFLCVCLCRSLWLRCTEEAHQLLYHLKPLCVLVCSLWPIMISVTICESIMTVSPTKREDKHLPYSIISSHHNYFLFSSTICWCSSAVCQKSLNIFKNGYDGPLVHLN